MNHQVSETIKTFFSASKAKEIELIQSLWSGYGKISRWKLIDAEIESLIAKIIYFPTTEKHPRGWNTDRSHERKVTSYKIEMEWYQNFASLNDSKCRIPKCYFIKDDGEEKLLLLEDLDAAGFPERRSSLNKEEAKVCLGWLANFHATYFSCSPKGLWPTGSYWHLSTRPDELQSMENGWLKENAFKLDSLLSSAKFQTIIHGDAKVANFCFSKDLKQVAALDFQYVGAGCGMKDVAYFLGSSLTAKECEANEEYLLNYYFSELKKALNELGIIININKLELEWRELYPIAWADFTRFLKGWMPEHKKINAYSEIMEEKAIIFLNKLNSN